MESLRPDFMVVGTQLRFQAWRQLSGTPDCVVDGRDYDTKRVKTKKLTSLEHTSVQAFKSVTKRSLIQEIRKAYFGAIVAQTQRPRHRARVRHQNLRIWEAAWIYTAKSHQNPFIIQCITQVLHGYINTLDCYPSLNNIKYSHQIHLLVRVIPSPLNLYRAKKQRRKEFH